MSKTNAIHFFSTLVIIFISGCTSIQTQGGIQVQYYKCPNGIIELSEEHCNINKSNPNDCSKLSKQEWIDRCLAYIPNNTDSSVCERIIGSGFKNICYENLAETTNNKEWCSKLTPYVYVEDCLNKFPKFGLEDLETTCNSDLDCATYRFENLCIEQCATSGLNSNNFQVAL